MGKRLVEQLGREKEYDTLSKWIANLLAAKILACETSSDDNERLRLQQQAVDLILKIWNERYCVPPCIRPFEQVNKAISYLAQRKDCEDNPLMAFRSQREEKDAVRRLSDAFDVMHNNAIRLLALTPLILQAGDDPLAWEEANRELLEEREIRVIDLVRDWVGILDGTARSETDWTGVKELTGEQRVSRVMTKLEGGLNDVRQALEEFKREVLGSSNGSEASSSHH